MEEIDEVYEFLRLKKSMDMVGFTADVQKRYSKGIQYFCLAFVFQIAKISSLMTISCWELAHRSLYCKQFFCTGFGYNTIN